MSEPTSVPWLALVPQQDRERCRAAGYGARTGLGHHLALVVVDVTYAFTGRPEVSAEPAHAAYPNSCGESAWRAVRALQPLVTAARCAGLPIVYTVDMSADLTSDDNVWSRKLMPAAGGRAADGAEIVHEVHPSGTDRVVVKSKPSAFFGTDLAKSLHERGARDLLIVGGTTSGCVRATVVDAFSHGFAVGVVADCTFDRSEISHAVSLFDMDQKYADVVELEAALALVASAASSTDARRALGSTRER